MVENQENLGDFVGKDAKHVKIGEWALAANIATHVGILVILRQIARKIFKIQGNEYRYTCGNSTSRQCNKCSRELTQNVWHCKCCKLVTYFDRNCQKVNWPKHKTLCNAIKLQTK